LGNLEDCLLTRDFERQYKSAQYMECVSVWELCEGNLDIGLLYWEI